MNNLGKIVGYGLGIAVVVLLLVQVNMLSKAGSGPGMFGGSTGGDWNVGGNLAVTGTSSLTGATTLTGDVTAGSLDVSTFTEGGGITASSTTQATNTLLASDFDTENVITYTPNVQATLTLPATSTLSSFVPNAGDVRTVYLQNASSTAGAILTIAGGTGMDVQEPTGAALTLEGLDWGILQFVRLANTDIAVFFDEFQEAD